MNMLKKLKTIIKNRPSVCKIVRPTYMVIYRIWMSDPLSIFSFLPFKFKMLFKKPYFGQHYYAGLTSNERYPMMSNLINQELRKGGNAYKILEIGSWAGQSALLWAMACKQNKKGRVFVIDAWQASENAPNRMKNAVKNNRIFNLFLHNIETSGVKDYVVPLKASSDIIAEILKPNTFDFVYVDGDHAYTQCKKDILNYINVLKVGGIICGDDFELHPNEIDIPYTKNHCEEDYIINSKTQVGFHPGVTLAINDVFGDASMKNGFWAMRKLNDGWENVVL